uniref:ECT2 n=1 Tax=Platynereis dumerilii TaxID=6359 RepID=A0A2H5BFA7_PLADU|nr:ECT2 [Platynereis dumerilii]
MADFSCRSSTATESVCGRDITVDPEEDLDVRFVVVGQKCMNNEELHRALEYYNCPVEQSDTGLEYLREALDDDTVFIMDNFDGQLFQQLHSAGARIMGPAVIIKNANLGKSLPNNTRPLYCTHLRPVILCFTGFKVKQDLAELAMLVHHMGGGIRRDISARVTHLVANSTSGEKYRLAVSMGIKIMTEDWIHRCWENKENLEFNPVDEDIIHNYQLSPFSFSTLSFYGFSKEEQRDMEDLTVANGGTCAEPGAPQCTHLVVDEHTVKKIPCEIHPKLQVVKSEWFWGSIQMDACANEQIYKFEVPQSADTPCENRPTKSTPKTLSGGKSRKRKRLRDNLAQLAAEGEVDSPFTNTKRRSNEVGHMSVSGSFLDATADMSLPVSTPTDKDAGKENESTPKGNVGKMSPRYLTIRELLQTEKNYVAIMQTVLKTFRDEIIKPDQPGGPLLDPTDVKMIFGKIPPIYEVHTKIRDELESLLVNWSESKCVGQVFLNHADALMKAYPPFVNFFENTKETIQHCDKAKPRFHAFLKVCLSRHDCWRQSLTELLIRPVQRLPSILLLLKDLLKRTDRNNADHANLEKAIATLEEVMTHINEDKRRAEGHQRMFDIVNDIDNCPPNLLSSHRSFSMKVDVVEVTDELSGRGENITLFVFSDSIEMCKRRVKVLNSKSPAAHGAKTPQKAYKHIEMVPLTFVKRLVNITDIRDERQVFAMVIKELDKREKLYAFMVVEEDLEERDELLMRMAKHICANTCRTDYENLLADYVAADLDIDLNDFQNNTLSRAATRFGRRVSRAFSFNRTPRKLRRAMSSMTQVMSPFSRRDSMTFAHPGSVNTITPRKTGHELRQRIASTNDLTDTDDSQFGLNNIPEDFGMRPHSPKRRRESIGESSESPLPSAPSTPNLASSINTTPWKFSRSASGR